MLASVSGSKPSPSSAVSVVPINKGSSDWALVSLASSGSGSVAFSVVISGGGALSGSPSGFEGAGNGGGEGGKMEGGAGGGEAEGGLGPAAVSASSFFVGCVSSMVFASCLDSVVAPPATSRSSSCLSLSFPARASGWTSELVESCEAALSLIGP